MSVPLLKGVPERVSKRRKSSLGLCLVCKDDCYDPKEERKDPKAWEELKDLAKKWKDLDRHGSLFKEVDWDKGPDGYFIHKNCRAVLGNKKTLQLLITRPKSANINPDEDEIRWYQA